MKAKPGDKIRSSVRGHKDEYGVVNWITDREINFTVTSPESESFGEHTSYVEDWEMYEEMGYLSVVEQDCE